MSSFKFIYEDEAKRKISEDILKWSLGREEYLNVISLPYNSADIFFTVVLNYLNNGKNVLYITEEENCEIIELIKKHSSFRNYSYIKKSEAHNLSPLTVATAQNAKKLFKYFDLVIYDDIREFSSKSKEDISSFLRENYHSRNKIITYTIEETIKNKRQIIHPIRNERKPFVEPREIVTRMDLNKGIPYVVYEYLKWSLQNERKVIIYVPCAENVKNVYDYSLDICKSICNNVLYVLKNHEDNKIISNFLKMKAAILITDDLEFQPMPLKNTDVMVFFSDNSVFNYKNLVYCCGKVENTGRVCKGEAVLLANSQTKSIDRAKSITRNFNKEAWEKGLLKI